MTKKFSASYKPHKDVKLAPKEFNFMSEDYYIAKCMDTCWNCRSELPLYGFFIKSPFSLLNQSVWKEKKISVFPYYITNLSGTVKDTMQEITKSYFFDYSNAINKYYFMNHCSFCSLKHGDFYLYCEPGGFFCPAGTQGAASISLYHVPEKFEATCDSYAELPFSGLFGYMQQRKMP